VVTGDGAFGSFVEEQLYNRLPPGPNHLSMTQIYFNVSPDYLLREYEQTTKDEHFPGNAP
jgi:hypothetical protein